MDASFALERLPRHAAMADLSVTVCFAESAFKNLINCYQISPDFPTPDIPAFLQAAKQPLETVITYELQSKHSIKMWLNLEVSYFDRKTEQRMDKNSFYPSTQRTCLTVDDISSAIDDSYAQISTLAGNYEQKGSSQVIDTIEKLHVQIVKYVPLRGSTYVKLPKYIQLKHAVVNPKNTDNQCFKWCLLAALHPKPHPERVKQYVKYQDELDFSDIPFPVDFKGIKTFEQQNNISVNVYGYEKDITVLYLSKLDKPERVVNLLLYENHYCLIKNLNRLLCDQNGAKRCGYFCPQCLQPIYSKPAYDEHVARCTPADFTSQILMPQGDDTVMKFRNHHRKLRMPCVVYADMECFTTKIQGCQPNTSAPFTHKYQHHEPYSYGLLVSKSCCDQAHFEKRPLIYRGEHAVEDFLASIVSLAETYHMEMKCPLNLTAAEEAAFRDAVVCNQCNEWLLFDRVRDHCHICGKFRGAIHNHCNQRLRLGKDIAVIFHNLRRYDGHLIMQKIGQTCESHGFDLDCIAKTSEDYLAFSLVKKSERWRIRFIDSCQFLCSSLDNLVKQLPLDGFIAMNKFIEPEHVRLLTRKGVFPYDYIDGWQKLDEKNIPPIQCFHSELTGENICQDDYDHACNVMKLLKLKSLGEYSDLYLTCDVLLLADVFENFRSFSLRTYGLDPCHYFTISSFSFDACLKFTKVNLELITCPDMYAFIESGTRGGLCSVPTRHARANNPLVGDYNPGHPSTYLIYFDVNNLYGTNMSELLPTGGFKWVENPETFDVLTDAFGELGYILEVDLVYPAHLHDQHNCYPLAPERLEICPDMLSPYCSRLAEKLKLNKLTTHKLSPNFYPKKHYVVHLRNLQFYLKHGLEVTRIHRVLKFSQSRWLEPYITVNTEMRKKATSNFEKDLFKLLNNSVYGKTMENVRKYRTVQLVTNETMAKKLAKKPNYQHSIVFSESLVAVCMQPKTVTLNKPIYVGFTVLELSKLLMFQFHYDYIRVKYGDRAKLLLTDTDSFIYRIQCEDIYKDMMEDIDRFDTSDYPSDHPLHSADNKKVLGKMKDETNGVPVEAFVGLRTKMYSLKYGSSEHKRAKGVKRSLVSKTLRYGDFETILLTQSSRYDQMNFIRSHRHEIYSVTLNKRSLSCFDDKRFIMDNGIDTLAYGHYRINKDK